VLEDPIRFAGAMLGEYRHVCAFFEGPEDEYRVTIPFLKEGIERNERAFYIVDPEVRADSLRRIQDAGVPVDELAASGQCEVHTWRETYLRAGRFQSGGMLKMVEEILTAGRGPFGLTRLVGHVEWAPRDQANTSELLEYETRLNLLLPNHPDPVVCAYQTSKWGAGAVMDILRTHPVVMIGGVMHENPFFVPPDEFLRELRERSETAHA